MRIVFLDISCPKPYSNQTLRDAPLGGTEATVIRVAEGLAATGRHEVYVAQHNRTEAEGDQVAYVPLGAVEGMEAGAIVSLRSPQLLPFARKTFPGARHFLWCHDFNHDEVASHAEMLKGVTVLGVSRTHKMLLADSLLKTGREGMRAEFIYNPIDDALQPDSSEVYHRRLVYFSSPHKGLKRTLEVFTALRRRDEDWEMYVANPGYLQNDSKLPEGVTDAGTLTHATILRLVRSAFCVFHLNSVFPETFGLVYAESNAVGTPCLTHAFGAAPEVLRDKQQLVDVKDTRAVIERLELWDREGRPNVQGREEFRLSSVLKRWEEVLS